MDIQHMDSLKAGFSEQSANAKIIHWAHHAATKVYIFDLLRTKPKFFYRSSIFRIEFASVRKLFSFGESTLRI